MLGMVEGFLRGWASARATEGTPTEQPQAAAGEPILEPNGAGETVEEVTALMEVTILAEQLQARVDELEAECAAITNLAGVLRLPGVRTWLLRTFHPDRNPDANEAERKALTDASQMIIAAYKFVERKT
jgi:hypothetical protein